MQTIYNREYWDRLSKMQQISITSATIRGALINSFIYIELFMADIVVVVDYESDYNKYHSGFRSTSRMIKDFLSVYDKIADLAGKYFTDKGSLENDIRYLADIRNRAAHFALLNNEEFLEHSDPFQDMYFYSVRNSQDIYCTMRGALVRDFDNIVMKFVQNFRELQSDVYVRMGKQMITKDIREQMIQVQHLDLKPEFPSLKL